MKLSEIIEEKCIDVSVRPAPKDQIIREMVRLASNSARMSNPEMVLQSVIDREAQGSTGIGGGIAIPHSKSPGVTELTGALGICREGTDFDSKDGNPVHLIFFLEAVPDNPGPHIKALGKIARLVQTSEFSQAVLGCRTPAEVHQLLKKIESADGLENARP